jgi:hypothetical protein
MVGFSISIKRIRSFGVFALPWALPSFKYWVLPLRTSERRGFLGRAVPQASQRHGVGDGLRLAAGVPM